MKLPVDANGCLAILFDICIAFAPEAPSGHIPCEFADNRSVGYEIYCPKEVDLPLE